MNVKFLIPLCAVAIVACSDRSHDTGVGGNTATEPAPPPPTTSTPGTPADTPPSETPPVEPAPGEAPPADAPPPPTNQ
jgi:hypothetical protein